MVRNLEVQIINPLVQNQPLFKSMQKQLTDYFSDLLSSPLDKLLSIPAELNIIKFHIGFAPILYALVDFNSSDKATFKMQISKTF